MTTAAEEIVEHEKKVREYEREAHEALQRFHNRTNYEPTTEETPLDLILRGEAGDEDDWEIRRDIILKVFLFLSADGPHPAKVLRRLYVLGHHMGVSPFRDLNLREKADLLNCSHGTIHWLMDKICVNPLRERGAKSWKAAGQKSLGSRGNYSQCQEGNSNRAGNKKPTKKKK